MMEEELKNFIKVWSSAIISISYCYYFSTRIKPGVFRLLSVLPVCVLFLLLPLFFSSIHFTGSTACLLTLLANFKLILFSFGKGPLIPFPPSLYRFLCFTCLPIKTQKNPKSQNHLLILVFVIKVAILGVLLHLYEYRQNMSPALVLGIYFVHIYLELDIILIFIKVVALITLGCDLEPQSNKPYLATSLQDFWGHRWNLMVPAILRQAVYAPMRRVSQRRMSSGWALYSGILATFFVSGLFHELLFFYVTRELPTWEVTLFFLLHGVCTAAELAVKKKTALIRRWKLSPAISRVITVGFVFVTGKWLFAPQLVRTDVAERATHEALLFADFVKHNLFILLGIICPN